jgi:hypothetical protein
MRGPSNVQTNDNDRKYDALVGEKSRSVWSTGYDGPSYDDMRNLGDECDR